MKTKEFVPFSESHLHHILCNFSNRPIEGCTQCIGLKEKYGDMPIAEIINKHFPDAIERKIPQ
jgi:hypothetical protein